MEMSFVNRNHLAYTVRLFASARHETTSKDQQWLIDRSPLLNKYTCTHHAYLKDKFPQAFYVDWVNGG